MQKEKKKVTSARILDLSHYHFESDLLVLEGTKYNDVVRGV